MKKQDFMVVGIITLLLLAVSCKKDNNSADYSVIDGEKAKIKNALDLSQAFNDTLKMVYDTAKVHKNNRYCIKYDTLFHQSDSMFMVHYSLFGDEMYKNGIMMQNYSPTNRMMQGGMMQGGVMNSGSMDMNRMMGDTVTVDGYYRSMYQLIEKHQLYDKGIYN